MNTTDWLVDIALLLIVVLQLRGERLTRRTILLPLAIIGWVGYHYLHDIPTAGNDVALIATFTGIGIAFGLAGGFLTRVRDIGGHIHIKATYAAAALWVISMGFRLGFAVWTSHPSGAQHVGDFSVAHDITSSQAWVAALLLMALSEVVVRIGTIVTRGQLVLARGKNADGDAAADAARVAPRNGSYV
ncbi:hypothetical protein [Streptomyces montanisoli]|uniref:hypothetical protein n=1 Tax=Streptomyces montanisoli TaxID=2798581 RepID=UPI001FD8056A|nr:hypothetical protein [Streptomyces montanisoli]